MKKQKLELQLILTMILTAICITFMVGHLANHKHIVKINTVAIYDEYISQQDSALDIVKTDGRQQILSLRKTYSELMVDSITVQKDSASINLRIIRPIRVSRDSITSGALVEVYWKKQLRQRIPFFEKLRK